MKRNILVVQILALSLVLIDAGCSNLQQKVGGTTLRSIGKTGPENTALVHVEGKPTFPLGWYSNLDTTVFQAMKAGGMNTVLPYSGENTIEKIGRFMDAAARHDLTVLVEIRRKEVLAINSGKRDFGELLSMVRNLMTKENLLGWYLIDEPHLQGEKGISPSVCKMMYDSIKAVDPRHPVFIVDTQWGWSGQWDADRSKSYAIACDVAMWDEYPLMDTMGVMPSRLFRVAETSHVAHEVVSREERSIPVVGVIQAYGYYNRARKENFPVGDTGRRRDPSYEELRYMTYSSIIHGSRGLFFWVYYRTDAQIEQHVHTMTKELHTHRIPDLVYRADLDSLVSSETHSGDADRNGLGDVNFLFREIDGHYFLLASNDSPHKLEHVQFAIDSSLTVKSVSRLDSNGSQKSMALSKNTFEENFTRVQIHFYRIEAQ